MSHFYGTLKGNRGEASRCGTKDSGMETYCASWRGAVRCKAYLKDGRDFVRVELTTWNGSGTQELLYDGPMGGINDVR
jgi:hypothetical protein